MLEFIAINVFGPLPRTAEGNQYVVVMIERYLNLTRALPISKAYSAPEENVILDFWILFYCILVSVSASDKLQFTSKLFALLFTALIV